MAPPDTALDVVGSPVSAYTQEALTFLLFLRSLLALRAFDPHRRWCALCVLVVFPTAGPR